MEHTQHVSDSHKGKGCGESNGRWTPKIHKRCDYCGKNMVTTAYRLSRGMGKCCSKECSNSAKTGIPNLKKRKGENRNCKECGKEFYALPSQVKKGWGHFCSMECQGKDRSKNKTPWNKGKACPGMAGVNNPAWKGGTATEYELIKGSREYKLWRKSVYERDFYTCQSCGARPDRKAGIKIHAHHILSFADFPHKRTDIANGVTLCKDCHWKAHGRKEKSK